MAIDSFLDVPFLALLIAANGVPALVAAASKGRWSAPIDFGLRLYDGRPLFGGHKTWRGLACGVLAAALVGALTPVGIAAGGACAMLSLVGDLISSFIKRRLGLPSGAAVPGLDQLAEAALPLLALIPREPADWMRAAVSCVVFVTVAALIDKLQLRKRFGVT